jgi:hypothetical protein
VRYYHPNPVEMRCSAKNGVITFSADGRVVPIPVAPFQLVEVDVRVEQGNVLVRRRGARSFSPYESLSGGEQPHA